MKTAYGSKRLARFVGCAAVTTCLAGAAVTAAPAASARVDVTLPVVNRHAAVSWGCGNVGQLGNGTYAGRSLYGPVEEMGGSVAQVAGGGGFALALRSDGTAWAWGQNQDGEMGNGTTSVTQFTPVQVSGLSAVVAVSAGADFGLALRSDGTVWAWGDNLVDQLGGGTESDSLVPVQVKGLVSISSIAAGAASALAIRTLLGTTSAWTWGEPADNIAGSTSVTEVPPIGAGIAGIAAGQNFSLVLGTDGSVWGWGWNFPDVLLTNVLSTNTPVRVVGPGSGITQLAADGSHVLALRSNETVLAWGYNECGDLGDGSAAQTTSPVQVSGLTTASQVAAGVDASYAVYLPPLVVQP